MAYDRDHILDATDLVVLADELLGAHSGARSPSWTCPEPTHAQTGRTPPLTVFVSRRGEQRWSCHGCGASGTAIDLVMRTRGMSVKEAMAWLASRGAVPSVTNRQPRHNRPRGMPLRVAERCAPDPQLDDYVTACEQLLWELTGRDPLSAAQVRRLLRTRIDPFSVRPTISNGRLVERLGLVSPAAAGPLAMDTAWRETRIDGAWHRTYWVASFPRLPQHPSWLEPLLSTPRACRTMTVFLQPVSAYQSRRRIERDLVKLDSDAQTKEEKGRRVDARHRRVTQALLDREQELVAGYAEMAYNAVICVSAPELAQLNEDCEVIEQTAREVGLELKVIDGRQDLAWACSLPFGLNPQHLLT